MIDRTYFAHGGHEGSWVYIEGVGHDQWHSKNGSYLGDNLRKTVGQYTGLKDSKGVEIYEGDIITIPNPEEIDAPSDLFKVVWLTTECAWGIDAILRGPDMLLMDVSREDIEIIGNIHENPELLRGDIK